MFFFLKKKLNCFNYSLLFFLLSSFLSFSFSTINRIFNCSSFSLLFLSSLFFVMRMFRTLHEYSLIIIYINNFDDYIKDCLNYLSLLYSITTTIISTTTTATTRTITSTTTKDLLQIILDDNIMYRDISQCVYECFTFLYVYVCLNLQEYFEYNSFLLYVVHSRFND